MVIESVKLGKIELIKDRDYTILSGSRATDVEETTLKLQGIGSYKGEVTTLWKLQKADAPESYARNVESSTYCGKSYTDVAVALPKIPEGAQFGDVVLGDAYYQADGTKYPYSIFPSGQKGIVGDTLYYSVDSCIDAEYRCVPVYADITVHVTGMQNYNDYTIRVTVTRRDRTTVTLSGIEDNQSFTYNGTAQTPAGTVTAEGTDIQSFDVTYQTADGADLSAAPKDAGSYRVTYKIPDSNDDYQGSAFYSFTIAPKEVTLDVRVYNRAYNGTTAATIKGTPAVAGKIGNDDVSVTIGQASFADKNAGEHDILFTDVTLSGADRDNYRLADNFASAKATITKKEITVTGVTAVSRDYEKGKTSVTLTGGTLEGIETADQGKVSFTLGTGTMETADAGTDKKVTTNIALTGAEAGNYKLTQPDVTVRITPKKLMAGSISHQKYVQYDGTAQEPEVTIRVFPTGELIDPSEYTVTYSNNVKPGTAGITIRNKDGGNYIVTSSYLTGEFTIGRRKVTVSGITAENRAYNGSTDATLDCSKMTVANKVEGEDLTVTVTGSFGSANVGNNKPVTLTVTLGGADAENYTLAEDSQKEATASITAAPVTITGIGADNKTYDGGVQADIRGEGIVKGKLTNDDVKVKPGKAEFADKKVGTGKTVTFSGFALEGSDAGNYRLTAQPASVTADITAKPVTLTVQVQDKPFDGNTDADYTATTEDFVTGDEVAVSGGKASFAYANVGTDIPVTFDGDFALTGEDAGNYTLAAQPKNIKGSIQPTRNYLDLNREDNRETFKDDTEIWVDGVACPVRTDFGRYVLLPDEGDLMTTYTYSAGSSALGFNNYPTGMRVYRLTRQDTGAHEERIEALDDLLQYEGCSIRVTGKKGIRMITSLTKANKAALTGSGLGGYTLVEYGTVVQWKDKLGGSSLTLANGGNNYAYKKGVADPVFANVGSLTQYTNVLVDYTEDDWGREMVLRPYIKLADTATGEQVTLYGGCVSRSIGYIATQNRTGVFQPGSTAYKYVWKIIHAVYGDQYDADYKK